MNIPPLTTQPGVPWYDLWPLRPPKRPAKRGFLQPKPKPVSVVDKVLASYPRDCEEHILFLSVARKLTVPANSEVTQNIILQEVGWSYKLQAILVSYLDELEITFISPDRRTIIDRGSVAAFGGGLPGKAWVEYRYLLPPQSVLTFNFRNTSGADLVIDCATIGQSVRGSV